MCKISNQNILITGSASGIGKLLAQKFVDKGASKLILLDKNKTALDLLIKELKEKNKNIF